jgi:hypothetical protein
MSFHFQGGDASINSVHLFPKNTDHIVVCNKTSAIYIMTFQGQVCDQHFIVVFGLICLRCRGWHCKVHFYAPQNVFHFRPWSAIPSHGFKSWKQPFAEMLGKGCVHKTQSGRTLLRNLHKRELYTYMHWAAL